MKKIFFTLTFLAFAFFAHKTFAAIPTPTPDLQQQLLNKIASRVAELNLVEKRGIIGTVNDVSNSQISLTDLKGNTRFVDVDELTKFFSSSSKTFGISDVTKGGTLGVLGLYNKQSKRILARDVTVMSSFPKTIFGVVASIDKINYEITIVKENGQKEIVEIQDITKTYSYSYGADATTKSGFSKIKEMDAIMAIGFPDKQDPNKILSTRIILFPDINATLRINVAPALNPTIPPSTGSGVKLYPLTK